MHVPTASDLRERRNALGITQKRLAELAGVSQPLIARIENDDVDPRLSTFRRIIDALNALEGKEEPKAKDLMSGPPKVVSRDDPLRRAIRIMSEGGFSQLPVVDRQEIVGAISERQIIEKMERTGDPARLATLSVGDVMGPALPTVDPATDLETLNHLLDRHPGVVVVEKGRPVGLITRTDVMRLVR